ncbi:vacuolar alkaline phosphatase [Coemansia sp. IMI 203386]|nr:vacuolar alkaline phosphatase [Coemansia sp. IMI 203386]
MACRWLLIWTLAAHTLISSSHAAPMPGSVPNHNQGRRNLIFMISDGFGIASEGLARAYVQTHSSRDIRWGSMLDSMLVGTTRTRSSNTLVTDSAAGATAFSCAKKTFNGGIATTDDNMPCGTVLEAAKHKGYTTGLVTTARISHATPAAFAAHAVDRDMEELIAQQLIGAGLNGTAAAGMGAASVDLMFGGGRCFFLPQSSHNGCRSDELDLWQMAQDRGFHTLSSRKQFDDLLKPHEPPSNSHTQLPILGLFSRNHMAYEIDRNPKDQPALSEMTAKALEILNTATNVTTAGETSTSPGFFVMIEGARIDMAGHDNDPAAHLHDIIEYWKTVAVVRDFIDRNPDTLLVSTSDHETGGLTLGVDPEYLWYPETLHPVRKSAEVICSELHHAEDLSSDQAILETHIRDIVLPTYLGISNFTAAEVSDISSAATEGTKACKRGVGRVVSNRAHVGWTTGGHTGADVGLYAYGKDSSQLRGSMDNTHVGEFLANYLSVDLDAATKSLVHVPTVQRGFVKRKH